MLVALRQSIQESETVTSQKWKLGLICWITGSQREGTRVGIQFLAGDVQPVQLQARKGNILETRFQPALMLSGDTVDGLSTPTLLTSTGLHIEARALRMQIGEEIQSIHARKKVSSTLTVDRFFFQQDFHITDEGEMVGDAEQQAKEGEENEEHIDLSATPGIYAEDFEKEYEEMKKKKGPEASLDDVILKKN